MTANSPTVQDLGLAERSAAVTGIGRRMDQLPISRLHVAIVILATLGFAFDLLEVALGNVLSAVFSAPPYSVAADRLSWLLSAMYVGAIPGALIAGWLADRYGRKIVLVGVLMLLCASSIAAAASPEINSLIVARCLSGLALGAYPPLIISYLTDLMPARRRGTLILIVSGCAALGPVAMIFLVRWLTPLQPLGIEAWRWAFIVGSVGSVVVGLCLNFLPESPRWLAARGRQAEADRALLRFERSKRLLPTTPVVPVAEAAPNDAAESAAEGRLNLGRLGLLGGMYFAAPWATVAFPLLMGAALIEKGFQLSDSLLYIGISMFGPAVSSILASFVIDRFERRLALIVFSLGMIGSAALFAASSDPVPVMVAAILFQVFSLLHVPTLTIYGAELFPTRYRARTSTAAWSINRLASAIAPLILLPMMKSLGIWPMVSLVLGALVLGILLVAVAPNGRAGQTVE